MRIARKALGKTEVCMNEIIKHLGFRWPQKSCHKFSLWSDTLRTPVHPRTLVDGAILREKSRRCCRGLVNLLIAAPCQSHLLHNLLDVLRPLKSRRRRRGQLPACPARRGKAHKSWPVLTQKPSSSSFFPTSFFQLLAATRKPYKLFLGFARGPHSESFTWTPNVDVALNRRLSNSCGVIE